jgi:hypothetical protein
VGVPTLEAFIHFEVYRKIIQVVKIHSAPRMLSQRRKTFIST